MVNLRILYSRKAKHHNKRRITKDPLTSLSAYNLKNNAMINQSVTNEQCYDNVLTEWSILFKKCSNVTMDTKSNFAKTTATTNRNRQKMSIFDNFSKENNGRSKTSSKKKKKMKTKMKKKKMANDNSYFAATSSGSRVCSRYGGRKEHVLTGNSYSSNKALHNDVLVVGKGTSKVWGKSDKECNLLLNPSNTNNSNSNSNDDDGDVDGIVTDDNNIKLPDRTDGIKESGAIQQSQSQSHSQSYSLRQQEQNVGQRGKRLSAEEKFLRDNQQHYGVNLYNAKLRSTRLIRQMSRRHLTDDAPILSPQRTSPPKQLHSTGPTPSTTYPLPPILSRSSSSSLIPSATPSPSTMPAPSAKKPPTSATKLKRKSPIDLLCAETYGFLNRHRLRHRERRARKFRRYKSSESSSAAASEDESSDISDDTPSLMINGAAKSDDMLVSGSIIEAQNDEARSKRPTLNELFLSDNRRYYKFKISKARLRSETSPTSITTRACKTFSGDLVTVASYPQRTTRRSSLSAAPPLPSPPPRLSTPPPPSLYVNGYRRGRGRPSRRMLLDESKPPILTRAARSFNVDKNNDDPKNDTPLDRLQSLSQSDVISGRRRSFINAVHSINVISNSTKLTDDSSLFKTLSSEQLTAVSSADNDSSGANTDVAIDSGQDNNRRRHSARLQQVKETVISDTGEQTTAANSSNNDRCYANNSSLPFSDDGEVTDEEPETGTSLPLANSSVRGRRKSFLSASYKIKSFAPSLINNNLVLHVKNHRVPSSLSSSSSTSSTSSSSVVRTLSSVSLSSSQSKVCRLKLPRITEMNEEFSVNQKVVTTPPPSVPSIASESVAVPDSKNFVGSSSDIETLAASSCAATVAEASTRSKITRLTEVKKESFDSPLTTTTTTSSLSKSVSEYPLATEKTAIPKEEAITTTRTLVAANEAPVHHLRKRNQSLIGAISKTSLLSTSSIDDVTLNNNNNNDKEIANNNNDSIATADSIVDDTTLNSNSLARSVPVNKNTEIDVTTLNNNNNIALVNNNCSINLNDDAALKSDLPTSGLESISSTSARLRRTRHMQQQPVVENRSSPSHLYDSIDIGFSFENVPSYEPWYDTFQRQDSFEEKHFRSYYNYPVNLLPYEIENLAGSGNEKSNHSKNVERKPKKLHTNNPVVLAVKDDDNTRQSPRCHPSTLANKFTKHKRRQLLLKKKLLLGRKKKVLSNSSSHTENNDRCVQRRNSGESSSNRAEMKYCAKQIESIDYMENHFKDTFIKRDDNIDKILPIVKLSMSRQQKTAVVARRKSRNQSSSVAGNSGNGNSSHGDNGNNGAASGGGGCVHSNGGLTNPCMQLDSNLLQDADALQVTLRAQDEPMYDIVHLIETAKLSDTLDRASNESPNNLPLFDNSHSGNASEGGTSSVNDFLGFVEEKKRRKYKKKKRKRRNLTGWPLAKKRYLRVMNELQRAHNHLVKLEDTSEDDEVDSIVNDDEQSISVENRLRSNSRRTISTTSNDQTVASSSLQQSAECKKSRERVITPKRR